jgi:2-dehydro-3-deoxyphosphogluconate aldolase/(4S)-4-hydroxy-2-oxoglutarate aldolase
MDKFIARLKELKVVPVIKINDSANAYDLGKALVEGGLPIAEVTFRTAAAEDAIREMRKVEGLIVGAGTIVSVEQAKKAVSAGAEFLVTAGFSRPVTEYAVANHIPIFPGVCTPTEILSIMEFDLPVAKFFPAEDFGGLKTIKSLSGPFPNMLFMPTGGISDKNILEYLSHPNIIACGGSWMVRENLIDEKKFDEIRGLVEAAVSLVRNS